MFKKSLNKKVKGSTIIEVLVAMAILSICSVLAVIIYLNIQKSTLPFLKIKAMELAKSELDKTLLAEDYFDRSGEVEGFNIVRSVKAKEGFPDCLALRIIIFDQQKKKLVELERTIYTAFEK